MRKFWFLVHLLKGRVFVKKKLPVATDGICADPATVATNYCQLGKYFRKILEKWERLKNLKWRIQKMRKRING